MPARTALDGERLQRGTLLLAPSGRDLTLASSPSGPVVSLSPTGLEQAPGDHRPGVDGLLVSAAATLGPRAVAVVVSGDGRDDALHPSTPRAALAAAGACGDVAGRVVVAAADGLGAALTAAVTGRTRPVPTLARAS